MPAPNSADLADHPGTRQVVIWSVFAVVLVLGIAFWLRFGNRIVPMLDVFSDR